MFLRLAASRTPTLFAEDDLSFDEESDDTTGEFRSPSVIPAVHSPLSNHSQRQLSPSSQTGVIPPRQANRAQCPRDAWKIFRKRIQRSRQPSNVQDTRSNQNRAPETIYFENLMTPRKTVVEGNTSPLATTSTVDSNKAPEASLSTPQACLNTALESNSTRDPVYQLPSNSGKTSGISPSFCRALQLSYEMRNELNGRNGGNQSRNSSIPAELKGKPHLVKWYRSHQRCGTKMPLPPSLRLPNILSNPRRGSSESTKPRAGSKQSQRTRNIFSAVPSFKNIVARRTHGNHIPSEDDKGRKNGPFPPHVIGKEGSLSYLDKLSEARKDRNLNAFQAKEQHEKSEAVLIKEKSGGVLDPSELISPITPYNPSPNAPNTNAPFNASSSKTASKSNSHGQAGKGLPITKGPTEVHVKQNIEERHGSHSKSILSEASQASPLRSSPLRIVSPTSISTKSSEQTPRGLSGTHPSIDVESILNHSGGGLGEERKSREDIAVKKQWNCESADEETEQNSDSEPSFWSSFGVSLPLTRDDRNRRRRGDSPSMSRICRRM